MPELIPAAPGSPEWLAARRADGCAICGEPFQAGDHVWSVLDSEGQPGRAHVSCDCLPKKVVRAPLRLSPYSRIGMIHGAYDHARPPLLRRGFHPAYARSWMYLKGFARGFLAAKVAGGAA